MRWTVEMDSKAGIKVVDIAYARVSVPDLDIAEQFLTDFGLLTVERSDTKLFMRGAGPAHHIYIAEKGEPGLIGFAFYAKDAADLERAALLPGAISGVEDIGEPGGGKRVRLREPNGYQIEIVHGIESLPELEIHQQPLNTAADPFARKGDLFRVPPGIPPVVRIGHGVIVTPDIAETTAWFRENLGFIGSDNVYAGSPEIQLGSFNRCDCGEEYVDHHTLGLFDFGGQKGMHHISFEVADIDAVMAGHDYLQGLGRYEHKWGVGRHNLGSQVFDYWADPWGRVHERWADTDRLNAGGGSDTVPVDALASQWGEPQPETFMQAMP